MNRISLSFLFVMSICAFAFAQNNDVNRCHTPVLSNSYESWIQNYLMKENQFANAKKTNVVYNIPVVFHIIHNGESIGTGRNISNSQITSQLSVLNQDFRKTNVDFSIWVTQPSFVSVAADCEITFSPANIDPNGLALAEPGINRINRNTMGWTGPSYTGMNEPGGYIDNTIKSTTFWDPTKYMNIWVLEMSDGVLGYAQFPVVPVGTVPITDVIGMGDSAATDGVVLDYRAIGNTGTANYPYDKGRTATHEIGHWLGLRHINGDSGCGNDHCADTPAQGSLTTSCPSIISNTVAAGCGTVSPNPPGKMYQNYMDYSDDRCLVMFTQDQKARMQACLANCIRRQTLTTSAVGVPETTANYEMDVMPNPSSGTILVKINSVNTIDCSISVFNTLGQSIVESRPMGSINTTVTIDLSSAPNGVYFVTARSGTFNKTKKIILNK